jgi:hypothetical protein
VNVVDSQTQATTIAAVRQGFTVRDKLDIDQFLGNAGAIAYRHGQKLVLPKGLGLERTEICHSLFQVPSTRLDPVLRELERTAERQQNSIRTLRDKYIDLTSCVRTINSELHIDRHLFGHCV